MGQGNTSNKPKKSKKIVLPSDVKEPKKQVEFELYKSFYTEDRILSTLNMTNMEISQMIGVSNDTLTDWAKHPDVIALRQKAIDDAFKQMKSVGKEDWKMWDKALERMGLVVVSKSENKNVETVTLNFSDLPDDSEYKKFLDSKKKK